MRPDTKLLKRNTRVSEKPCSNRRRIKFRGQVSLKELRAISKIDQELAAGFVRETGELELDNIPAR